jgi:hypothetical protein
MDRGHDGECGGRMIDTERVWEHVQRESEEGIVIFSPTYVVNTSGLPEEQVVAALDALVACGRMERVTRLKCGHGHLLSENRTDTDKPEDWWCHLCNRNDGRKVRRDDLQIQRHFELPEAKRPKVLGEREARAEVRRLTAALAESRAALQNFLAVWGRDGATDDEWGDALRRANAVLAGPK